MHRFPVAARNRVNNFTCWRALSLNELFIRRMPRSELFDGGKWRGGGEGMLRNGGPGALCFCPQGHGFSRVWLGHNSCWPITRTEPRPGPFRYFTAKHLWESPTTVPLPM